MGASENERLKAFFAFATEVHARRRDTGEVARAILVALRLLDLQSHRGRRSFDARLRAILAAPWGTGAPEEWRLRNAAGTVANAAVDCMPKEALQRLAAAMPNVAFGIPLADSAPGICTPPSGEEYQKLLLWIIGCRLKARPSPRKADASRLRRARVIDPGADEPTGVGLRRWLAARTMKIPWPTRMLNPPTIAAEVGPGAVVGAEDAPGSSLSAARLPTNPSGSALLPKQTSAGAADASSVGAVAASLAATVAPAMAEAENGPAIPPVDAPAATILVVAQDAVPAPSPASACTLGGALQEALDVPPEAVVLALDEEVRAERRRRAAEIAARLDADAADGRLALAPFAEPVAPGGLVLRGGEALRDCEIWAIGDIHGDLLALECCVAAIARAAGDRPHLVLLLGDLIDDGALSYDTMLRAMELLAAAPDRFALLAGNHDVALSYDEATGTFASDVEPGDLADDLNRMRQDEAVVAAGRAFVRLIARTPRALFLPDGTLAAHGGVPQRDLWDGLATPGDLDDALCRNDFVWCRASERARRRLPSRAMRGAEFGCEDFAEFCALASGRLGIPLGRMLRGHDHFEGRFCLYERYRTNPIVGVNALSRRLDRELFGAFARRPVVARWRAGERIDVFPVAVPASAVESQFGGAEQTAGAAADGSADAAATIASDTAATVASDALATLAADASVAAASDTAATAVAHDVAAVASDVAADRERGA